MEVGWYLRFGKSDRIEAQVSIKAAPQVRHLEHIFPDWDFSYEERDDHVLAVMDRKKPVYGGI